MKKLTAGQAKALKTINENPGNVVAWYQFPELSDMIKINGNVERSLVRLDLAEEVETNRTYETYNGTRKATAWALTAKGRAALSI